MPTLSAIGCIVGTEESLTKQKKKGGGGKEASVNYSVKWKERKSSASTWFSSGNG